MSGLTPAQAAILAADPDDASQAIDIGALALLFASLPGEFGRFRRSLMDLQPDQAEWIAALQPGDLIDLAAVLAPEGAE